MKRTFALLLAFAFILPSAAALASREGDRVVAEIRGLSADVKKLQDRSVQVRRSIRSGRITRAKGDAEIAGIRRSINQKNARIRELRAELVRIEEETMRILALPPPPPPPPPPPRLPEPAVGPDEPAEPERDPEASGFAVKGGISGGALLLSADYSAPIGQDMSVFAGGGYGFGGGYNVISAVACGLYRMDENFIGLTVNYMHYSGAARNTGGQLGAGLIAGRYFDRFFVQAGYNSAGGALLELGYIL